MKRLILAAAVVVMTVFGVKAQNIDYPKHEIGVAYGWVSNSDWLTFTRTVIEAAFGQRYENEKYMGPVGLEYFYHMEPWFSLGAICTYGQLSKDIYYNGDKEGKSTTHCISVLPAAKFDWLRREKVGLYSKAAFGVTYRAEKNAYDKGASHSDETINGFHVNWQLTAIGIEVGGSLRVFAEFGAGEEGMGLAGLRYKF